MDKKFSILYVDDEESNLHIFKDTFRREYIIYTAISAKEGLKILDNEKIDLILTDQRMPEMDGVEFLKNALKNYPDLNRILITAYSDFDAIRNAINEAQIFQYIQKPWTEDKLRSIIEQGLEVYRLKIENTKLTNDLKDKNEQLVKMNSELLNLDKLKNDFLSLISHEIRTPLNGLVGPFQLLKEEFKNESENILTLFNILENSVNKLEQFSISALNITALKSKKYKVHLEDVDFNQVLQSTISLLGDNIYNKKVNFIYDIKANVVIADLDLFKISLKELIENAIKFSDEAGVINIKTFIEDEWVVIQVTDKGKGLEPKYLDHLFELFISSDDIKNKGLGLNLALIKLIMDAHSGKIEIKNNDKIQGVTVKLYFKNTKQTLK
ncbi:MAG: hypothetical protein A2041_10970 [Bacteroidetes bacterium GWA2_31_9b]|nr:MAG: hypothetical protein A2041_10970 [Bacteroidetes bacterium GWA2_31_9b]